MRWRLASDAIHRRLWASAARNSLLASPNEVGDFIVALDDQNFWRLDLFPEIAELRALRFNQLIDINLGDEGVMGSKEPIIKNLPYKEPLLDLADGIIDRFDESACSGLSQYGSEAPA